jgi:signal peptidase I
MSKSKPPLAVVPAAGAAKNSKSSASSNAPLRDPMAEMGRTVRETIESIVIAFVLAFLFRTFEAEAFVIPTGSMAPTLQGRHKDLECAKCGHRIRSSASDEEKAMEMAMQGRFGSDGVARAQVVDVTCPICRYRTSVDPQTDDGRQYPSYNGDRIIVAKFPYDFVDPKRWDVVVFKFPNDAKTNYIKRLVGLPNESVRIRHGDIFTWPSDVEEEDWSIERKPPAKQLAMSQLVHDSDYVAEELSAVGWPLSWQPKRADNGWKTDDGGRSYHIDTAKGEAWLRYRHYAPSPQDWQRAQRGAPLTADQMPQPQLITDFYTYNNSVLRGGEQRSASAMGLHWVGDLMLHATVEVQSASGQLVLDLVEGGKSFRAAIDVASGAASLAISGLPSFEPKAETKLRGPGTYRVVFANFDDELRLWIDGKLVAFDKPTTYEPLGNEAPQSKEGDPGDLAPVGIAAADGLTATVRSLQVKRDIYYIADIQGTREAGVLSDYEYGALIPNMKPDELAAFMSTPAAWRRVNQDGKNPFELRRSVEFDMEEDQFFVLGDNSPASADSRLWDHHHFVGRELMIGKALFIYWPHSFNKIPGTNIPFPMFPNIGDMEFVR